MRKLMYIDHFTEYNSNSYWLNAFKGYFETVIPIEILTHNQEQLLQLIISHKPDVIHFGGSVKKEKSVSIELYKKIREQVPKVRMTAFYGDVYYSEYNNLRLKYIDCLCVSSYTHISFKNSHYTPCPIKEEWINEEKFTKEYDIAFCGNNYSPYRHSVLKKLDEKYDLHLWGNKWDGFKNNHGPCTTEQSLNVYKKSKIALADVVGDYCRHSHMENKCTLNRSFFQNKICRNYNCPNFCPHIMYFSNRMIIALASGTPVVSSYRVGMEFMLKNDHNILWYHDIDENKKLIDELLCNEDKGKEIGANGKDFASTYTFKNIIKKLMEEK